MTGKMVWQRDGPLLLFDSNEAFDCLAWMASTVDERAFLVAMSRLASNHTGTRAHLQWINVVQYAFSVPWGMIQSTMGCGNVGYIAHLITAVK
jgi:hypothetical protein